MYMPHFLTVTIEGREYGTELTGERTYEGLFIRRADGTWQQTAGHSQTPGFTTAAKFSRWVHRITLADRKAARELRVWQATPDAARAEAEFRRDCDAALERDMRNSEAV